MKLVYGWIVGLSLVGACAVEPGPLASEREVGEVSSELGTGAQTQLSCTSVWECDQICGQWINGVLVRYGTNVLHRYCDDGSDTIKQTHPCGEACF